MTIEPYKLIKLKDGRIGTILKDYQEKDVAAVAIDGDENIYWIKHENIGRSDIHIKDAFIEK